MAKTTSIHLQRLNVRLNALRRRLGGDDFDALLITHPVDIRYLTGFIGDDSWALVTAAAGKVTIISDSRFEQQIGREAPQVSLRLRQKGLAEALSEVIADSRIKRLAIQKDHLTVGDFEKLGKALARSIGKRGIKPWNDGLFEQRAVKDAAEVGQIRKAARIQQDALRQTLEYAKPGMRETEVCAFLEYRMRALGADGPSFATIVAADANAALPHAIPGTARLKQGGFVLIDWGAKAGGYCSDMTRCMAFGSMKPKLREIYAVVLEAQQSALARLAPGMELADADAAARRVIEKAGYGDHFGHGLGHGVGLEIHEEPRLSKRAEGVLEVGHVVTVEPGIYLPGVGGVRIEDDAVITAQGAKVLTDLPKTLESAII